MKSAAFEIDFSEDKMAVNLKIVCIPEYCCAECLKEFLVRFLNSMDKKDSKKKGMH